MSTESTTSTVSPMTIINGMCKPDADHEAGDGLFIWHICNNDIILAVFFEKGRDFIGRPLKEEFDETIEGLKAEGWIDMTDEQMKRFRPEM